MGDNGKISGRRHEVRKEGREETSVESNLARAASPSLPKVPILHKEAGTCRLQMCPFLGGSGPQYTKRFLWLS